MKIDEKILSTLTDEQKKKVEAAKTPEGLLSITKENGYDLSPEQLEAVSGSGWDYCKEKSCYYHGACNEAV